MRTGTRGVAVIAVLAAAVAAFAVVAPTAGAGTNEVAPTLVRSWGVTAHSHGIDVDADGNLYVGTGADQVVKLAPDGTQLAAWGTPGTADHEIQSIDGITVAPDGHVWVADWTDRHLKKFTADGVFVAAYNSSTVTDIAFEPNGTLYAVSGVRRVAKFAPDGTPSSGWDLQGASSYGQAVAVADGEVYVANELLERVEVYDTAGTFLRMFGSQGTGPGQFSNGGLVAIEVAGGHVFALDNARSTIQRFTTAGVYVDMFASAGGGDGQLSNATELAVGSDGHVWVADNGLSRVQHFDASLAPAGSLSIPDAASTQFLAAGGLARDGDGNLYVGDRYRIVKLDPDGGVLTTWGGRGSGPGQIDVARDVDVARGSAWVVDGLNDRVQRFGLDGTFHAQFGNTGVSPATLSDPFGIDVVDDRVYVADAQRIKVYEADGTFVESHVLADKIRAVAVDDAGRRWAAGNDGISVLSSAGELLGVSSDPGFLSATGLAGIEIDPAGSVWALHPASNSWRRVQLVGGTITAGLSFNVPGADSKDLAFSADRRIVVSSSGAPQLSELQAGTGPLVDIQLRVDMGLANVGDPLEHEVVVHNTGTVTLTGISLDLPGAPGCSQGLADLAPGASHVVPCTHVLEPGDAGAYVASATVSSVQGAEASSEAIPVAVGTDPAPVLDASLSVSSSALSSIDGAPGAGWYISRPAANTIQRYDDGAQAVGSIVAPVGNDIAVGPDGDLYVTGSATPTGNGEPWGLFSRYSDSGVLELEHPSVAGYFRGLDVGGDGQVYAVENYRTVCTFYYDGWCASHAQQGADQLRRFPASGGAPTALAAPGMLNRPADVAVHDGLVHVADKGNDRVVTFSTAGAVVRMLSIADPVSVATDAAGTLYVASGQGRMMQAFASDGTLRSTWQHPVTRRPQDLRLAVDAKGRLLVLDADAAKVHRYAASGAVTGTVTSSGGGPVPDAWVAVLRQSDFSIAGTALTDADGSFTAAVRSGLYYVYLIDSSGAHAAGFAGGVTPTPAVVSAFGATEVDGVMTAQRGAVVGAVTQTESGDPLPDAAAVVMSATGQAQRIAPVDGDGEFRIEGLTPGNRLVAHFDRSGAHAPRFFDGATNAAAATPVPVTAGADASAGGSLPLQATPGTGATLSGVVTGTDSGDPVTDATVLVLRASDFGFVRAGHTDQDGEYSIDVPAGSFLLAFLTSSGRHQVEWHDDLPYNSLGAAVPVVAPAVVDVDLNPTTARVGGTVTDQSSGDPLAGAWVLAIGPSGLAGGAVTDAEGDYSIAGLAPGTYRVTFADVVGGRPQDYWHDAADFSSATPLAVSVGDDLDIDGVLG